MKIRVIDQGRVETDFSAAYSCPPPNGGRGNFEIGPLPTVGYLIAANGSIGATQGTETVWSERFATDGTITGRFIASFCSPTIQARFTARWTRP